MFLTNLKVILRYQKQQTQPKQSTIKLYPDTCALTWTRGLWNFTDAMSNSFSPTVMNGTSVCSLNAYMTLQLNLGGPVCLIYFISRCLTSSIGDAHTKTTTCRTNGAWTSFLHTAPDYNRARTSFHTAPRVCSFSAYKMTLQLNQLPEWTSLP